MTQNLLDNSSLVDETIRRIREHEPEKGYYLAFSGGKDSICIYWLAKMAGVKFRAVYHMTSIDPRGVPQFIRKHYPDVEIEKPKYKGKRTNFYELVAQKGLPKRYIRWCCSVLKEGGGDKGDTVMLGVRRDESVARSNRQMFYEWKGRFNFLPIFDWKTNDVWDFIKSNHFPYPDLYDNGHKRLGCVMCPLSCKASRARDYEEYPERVRAIEMALAKFLKYKPDSTITKTGKNPHEMVIHWVFEGPEKSAKGVCLGDFIDTKDDEL